MVMRFEFTFGTSRSPRRRDEGRPARILILSDLRGSAGEAPERVVDRALVRVDVDNIDDVLARCAPSVVLGAQAAGARLQFRTFQDFHPDALVENRPLFGRLLDLRKRLEHPGTFAGAVAELRAEAAADDAVPSEDAVPRPVPDEGRSTVERLLGKRPAAAPIAQAPPRVFSTVDGLIRRIIAPHVVPAVDPQLPQLLSAVDVASSDVMRRVLHDPGFQEVEATWRGIQWLVSSLELGEELELCLLHVTRGELSSGTGPESGLYRRLVDREARTAGGLELSVLVGDYRFGATPEDLAVLESMGALAQAVGAPFVAGCEASLLGSSALAQQPDPRDWSALDPKTEARWSALRAAPVARHIGLSLPRFLLRLPYGGRSDPINAFGFEEQPPTPDHESFLWGNPAFACAAVMARVLQAESVPADAGDITGLPAFVSTADDETRLQPCAEASLSERAVGAILARGIMPLVGFKDRDVARLVRLQSIADPPTALVG
jgi:type VI secretion system ImpC/EvpB family protein/type VI secretion system ImpB/VipA family protein